jgi:hypothetical protein
MLGTSVSARQYRSILDRARADVSGPWLQFDEQVVHASYNHAPFLLRHRLNEHPAFSLESLFELCRRMDRRDVKVRAGIVPKDCPFDSSLADHRQGLTLEDAIGDLSGRRAYIAIYNPEKDPHYRPLIEGLLGEIGLAVQRHDRRMNWYSTYVFISSAESLTPYHMDREMNFLLQIRGTKLAELWRGYDDAVMTPAQRDHLFSHAEDARAKYCDDLDAKAQRFELAPGLGVHHPFIAPHLVRTLSEVSVSLAITFRTPRSDVWSDAHRFNERILRRLRLPAGSVRRSAAIDLTKAAIFRVARGAHRLGGGAAVGD